MNLMQILLIVGALLILWVLVDKFSPDATLTYIVKIVIFILAVGIFISKLLPMAGINF